MSQGSSNPTQNLAKIAGTVVAVNSGTVDAGTQRVVLATNQPAIPVTDNGGSLTVDGTVSISGTVPVSGPLTDAQLRATAVPVSGTVTANTGLSQPLTDTQLRASAVSVSLASVPSHAVTNAGTFAVQVSSALPTGANTIGAISNTSFAATQSGTWNIGSITTLPSLPTGTNSIGNIGTVSTVTNISQFNGQAIAMGTGIRTAGTQRVTIATDDLVTVTGPLTDSQLRASAVPVSGTISISSLPSGTNNIGDVDVLTLPSIPSGSNTIGSINQAGTWTVQPGNTANTTPWLVRKAEQLGTATALGSLNASISQALSGNIGAAAVITATSAPIGITLTPQASYDGGTNWVSVKFFDSATETAVSTLSSFTIGASYTITASNGATHVRVLASSWASGSVTVRLSATNSSGLTSLLSGAEHDLSSGSFVQMIGGYASSTAPTAVSANGDAVRLWATTNGALNIADGGGSLTVDGTVSISGTVPVSGPLTDAQLRATAVPVSLASVPSHAVTNAGTFAVQATQSGTWNIGSITTLPSLPAGTNNIGDVDVLTLPAITIAASQTLGTVTNLSQLGGQAVTMGSGVRTAGTQRVTIATDDLVPVSGTVSINALPAGTNNIGDVDVLSLPSIPAGSNTIGNVNQAGTWNITNISGTVSLPTGAATSANQSTMITALQLLDDAVGTDGLAVAAGMLRVGGTDGTNNQIISVTTAGAVNIADNGGSLTVDAPATTPVFIRISNGSTAVDTLPVSGPLTDAQLRATAVPVSGTVSVNALPAGTNNIGDVDVLTLPAITIAASQTLGTVTTVGTVTSVSQLAGQPINLGAGSTGTGTLRVVEAGAATGTQTNPSLSTTSATVLAANTARRGASVFNGSTSIVYLRLSATAASSTVYTTKLQPDDLYEVPGYYNGAISGILNTGTTTLVQVTEIT